MYLRKNDESWERREQDTVKLNFPPESKLVLAGTIQFASALQLARQRLALTHPSLAVPKCRPLSPGEVLGCTAPVINPDTTDAIVFLSDGRFHLEAIMIANPSIAAYRYDPYGRVFTRERYDHAGMRAVRRRAIEAARVAQRWGVVMGTLGRQGNPAILTTLEAHLKERGVPYTLMLMSEVSPLRLDMFPGLDAFVQIACPRLSIDWGEGFSRPTLTPYEALVALGVVPSWWEGQQAQGAVAAADATPAVVSKEQEAVAPYPMDYYAKEGGVWNSSYHKK
ncbi:Diphthamide biosynthesis protein 1 [Tetrabaena socialis]|uniref:2-(3-amino-3-carboxypropyl)histidine synthase subunit 1 n=1 Tax=Tetrabaena socialis TaxID=47790 RepID=A0A2J8A9I2_9CHLO|nr:Diphthamide biosynthesis protein 1 [Tetrabaena socialis]|eukprot:PNH09188.1 Diphthamide biosynthesis protein 1 [Tetrabaena socialis]